jgi:hypothetical protein
VSSLPESHTGGTPAEKGTVLFLDADGSLFPSEEIAFVASSKSPTGCSLLSGWSGGTPPKSYAEPLSATTFVTPPSGC